MTIRQMGFHERWSMARQNTGRPHIVLYVVSYTTASLPSTAFLHERVTTLQNRLPMLSARVVGSKTNKPGYVPGEHWSPAQLVRDAEFVPGTPDSEVAYLYNAELARFEASDFDGPNTPLWSITRATPRAADGSETDCPRAYLVIAYNHLMVDGRGTTHMLKALTAENIDYVVAENWETPTRMDDTVPLKPSIPFLLPVAFRELFLPKMPYFIQKPFTSADPWPASAVHTSPLESPSNVAFIRISPTQVQQLKEAGKAHGIATLHPVLKMAYIAAMWDVFHTKGPVKFATGSPRDERNPALGHAAITHNYVSNLEWETSLSGKESFWGRTKKLSERLSSKAGITAGRMTMGLLALLPDPVFDTSSSSYDPRVPTGWEDYFMRRASSPTPYRDSMSISNLGLIQLPPGATDVVWGQTASPFGSAYMVNAIGHSGGIRLTSGFREGSGTDMERTQRVHATFMRIIERICGEKSTGKESIAEMCA